MENEITIEDIKAIRDKLKVFNKLWAKDLAEKMSTAGTTLNESAVYNIVNSVRKHQQHRRLFVVHAKKLLAEYESKQKKVAVDVENLLEAKTA